MAGVAQLTSLALQHCSLVDGSLQGLASLTGLRHLQLADNFLTAASLTEVARLEQLVSETWLWESLKGKLVGKN